LDHSTFSILQNSTDWLEEQRATQLVSQQMLSESRKGSRKCKSKLKTLIKARQRKMFFFTESRKRIALDGRTAISTKSHPSADTITFSPMLDLGETR
jgi:hypothetical protein